MRITPLIILPIIFTAAIAGILYLPVFPDGTWSECTGTHCITVVQYDSFSYAYGGYGGVFLSGVNSYRVDVRACFCAFIPANAVRSNGTPCCAGTSFSGVMTIIGILLALDGYSVILLMVRRYRWYR